MSAVNFRKELMKIMPGYKWTISREYKRVSEITGISSLVATGIKSSGYNRLSTLSVTRREKDGIVEYEARSAGNGTKSPWMHMHTDATLARALRGLQDHYEAMAGTYHKLASALQSARAHPNEKGGRHG